MTTCVHDMYCTLKAVYDYTGCLNVIFLEKCVGIVFTSMDMEVVRVHSYVVREGKQKRCGV